CWAPPSPPGTARRAPATCATPGPTSVAPAATWASSRPSPSRKAWRERCAGTRTAADPPRGDRAPRACLLLHALLVQGVERRAGLLGRLLEPAQELLLVVVDLFVREEHLAQPAGLLGVDAAIGQHVLLDGLEEQPLEAGADLLLAGPGLLLGLVAQ